MMRVRIGSQTLCRTACRLRCACQLSACPGARWHYSWGLRRGWHTQPRGVCIRAMGNSQSQRAERLRPLCDTLLGCGAVRLFVQCNCQERTSTRSYVSLRPWQLWPVRLRALHSVQTWADFSVGGHSVGCSTPLWRLRSVRLTRRRWPPFLPLQPFWHLGCDAIVLYPMYLSIKNRSAATTLSSAVFDRCGTGPRSFGATFRIPGVKTEKTAKE